jgi:hypothetical protein
MEQINSILDETNDDANEKEVIQALGDAVRIYGESLGDEMVPFFNIKRQDDEVFAEALFKAASDARLGLLFISEIDDHREFELGIERLVEQMNVLNDDADGFMVYAFDALAMSGYDKTGSEKFRNRATFNDRLAYFRSEYEATRTIKTYEEA